MSQRTDSTADNSLSKALDDVETYLNQIKSPAPQEIGGGNVVSFLSDSGSAYDWTGSLTTVTGNFGASTFLISATAQHMATLYANFIAKLFVGSPTAWYRPSNYLADEVAGNIGFLYSVTDVPSNAPNIKNVIFTINGDKRSTIYLKFYVQALDQVTFTVTRLT